MKVYKSIDLGQDCNICGYSDGLPFKLARAMTERILDKERLHSQPYRL